MHCSFCAETIRKGLGRMEGVREVSVSLAHEEALIHYDPEKRSPTELLDALRDLGFTTSDPKKARTHEEEEAELRREKDRLVLTGALAWMAFVSMVLMWVGKPHPWTPWAMMALALITVFGPGLYILRMAVGSARRGILNQHFLMEFAAFAGLAGGFLGLVYPAFPSPDFFGVAVFVTAYHILSGYTSLLVRTKASQAVRKLLSLQPATARVVQNGREEEVPVEAIPPGALVRIRPGEHVPVDGVVAEGHSTVDESLVTGEPIPKEKGPGEEVIGGSLNHHGSLLVRVTRVGEESFLFRVARSIEEARALKPGILLLAERVLLYFVPGVLAFAGGAFLFWAAGAWLLWGSPLWARAGFAALAVLVMGYPCALGMATPLALINAGGEAARRGILLRSGEAIQAYKDVSVFVFDKTGTLTEGKPSVAEIVPLGGRASQEILQTAASLENASEHPLAGAIVTRAEEEGLELLPSEDFRAVPGRGVRGRVAGKETWVGTLRFLAEEGADVREVQRIAGEFEAKGLTVVGLAESAEVTGLFCLSDRIKEDTQETVERLRRMGLETVMITGDNRRTAERVAEELGIEEVLAQVLPQDKSERVRQIQRQGRRVAFVGDGINDAPSLMQADVGLAIGSGTDIAIESADIVLVGERMGSVYESFLIAKRSYRKTVQNIALAFAFNGLGVPLAATGVVEPVWAMIAMAASVGTVLLNSFGGRLIPKGRESAPEGRPGEAEGVSGEARTLAFTVKGMH
ncbi:MAG: cation-translocating P-type ATPase [Candidatus Tectomicrobia bacterium]|nr:cation-translocating P-type ATPase [Candidatus Tectomicrobia bacterium]